MRDIFSKKELDLIQNAFRNFEEYRKTDEFKREQKIQKIKELDVYEIDDYLGDWIVSTPD